MIIPAHNEMWVITSQEIKIKDRNVVYFEREKVEYLYCDPDSDSAEPMIFDCEFNKYFPITGYAIEGVYVKGCDNSILHDKLYSKNKNFKLFDDIEVAD
jgi:hypothetical protein